jgi:hypothetical protein
MAESKRTFDLNLNFGFPINPKTIVHSVVSKYLSDKMGHLAGIPTSIANNVLSKSFPIKELQGIGDLGFGHLSARGGANNSSFFVRPVLAYLANSAKASNGLSATGTLSVVTNLNVINDKLSNLSIGLSDQINTAFKNGLGSSSSIIINDLQKTALVLKDAASYLETVGDLETSKYLLQEVIKLEQIKNIVSDPSRTSAESLEYAAYTISASLNKLRNSITAISDFDAVLGSVATLDSSVGAVLSESWNILNTSDVGNSLIKNAFAITNRIMTKDGISGPYAWASAFISSVLSDAGIGGLDASSPAAWTSWGFPVNINNPAKFKPNDLLIFTTAAGLMHMGFIKSYNPKTRKATIVGGNQGGGAGAITITLNTPFFSMKGQLPTGLLLRHVRRPPVPPSEKASLPEEVPPPTESSGSYLTNRQRERDAARGNTPSL